MRNTPTLSGSRIRLIDLHVCAARSRTAGNIENHSRQVLTSNDCIVPVFDNFSVIESKLIELGTYNRRIHKVEGLGGRSICTIQLKSGTRCYRATGDVCDLLSVQSRHNPIALAVFLDDPLLGPGSIGGIGLQLRAVGIIAARYIQNRASTMNRNSAIPILRCRNIERLDT